MDQREVMQQLEELARHSGRELRAVLAPPEPRHLRLGGPRLVHRRSGVRLCLVHLPEPLLLGEEVVLASQAAAFGVSVRERARPLAPDQDDDAAPLYLAPDELARVVAPPFELVRDEEWEAAYRAGTRTRFPWGDDPPRAPPAGAHAFGLVGMGWFDELTADRTLRGGAAMTWPWSADDPPERTWGPLEASRRRAWDGVAPCAVRLALRLA